MNKEKIRKKMRDLRANISPSLKNKWDKKIEARLLKSDLFKKAKTIGMYISNTSEVSTDFLLKTAFNNPKTTAKKIVVPKTKQKHIHLYELTRPHKLEPGKFNIREPHMSEKLFKEWGKIDLFIVPGIAFDLRGHRIGYGGGYFDRLLTKLNCTTIALSYELQIVDIIPDKKYDVAVSYILTPQRLILCRNSPTFRRRIRQSTTSCRAK